MDQELTKFYDTHKSLIELTALVFVVTTLFFSAPNEVGQLGSSIHQLKFLFLVMSAGLMSYLLLRSLSILDATSTTKPSGAALNIDQVQKLSAEISALLKEIGIRFFFIFLAFLLTINLYIYIALKFPKESIFLCLVAIYFVASALLLPKITDRVLRGWVNSGFRQNEYLMFFLVFLVIFAYGMLPTALYINQFWYKFLPLI